MRLKVRSTGRPNGPRGEAVAAGRAEPDLKGNFGVNVTWGKWHFGAAFDYRIGGQTFNRTLYDVQFGVRSTTSTGGR